MRAVTVIKYHAVTFESIVMFANASGAMCVSLMAPEVCTLVLFISKCVQYSINKKMLH